MNIKYLVKDFFNVYIRHHCTFQEYINRRFKSNKYTLVNNRLVNEVVTIDGFFIPLYQCNGTLEQVYNDYNFTDLRPSDNVLDIGAHIGAFSLKVAPYVNKVYSVEPLFYNELFVNMVRNKVHNMVPLEYSLSEYTKHSVKSMGREKTVNGATFKELLGMCEDKITFLKTDCEGGEWLIRKSSLSGIRRIEAEVHSFEGEKLEDFVKMLENDNYRVEYEKRSKKTWLVHAFKKSD